jgi:hypothetical protein
VEAPPAAGGAAVLFVKMGALRLAPALFALACGAAEIRAKPIKYNIQNVR